MGDNKWTWQQINLFNQIYCRLSFTNGLRCCLDQRLEYWIKSYHFLGQKAGKQALSWNSQGLQYIYTLVPFEADVLFTDFALKATTNYDETARRVAVGGNEKIERKQCFWKLLRSFTRNNSRTDFASKFNQNGYFRREPINISHLSGATAKNSHRLLTASS